MSRNGKEHYKILITQAVCFVLADNGNGHKTSEGQRTNAMSKIVDNILKDVKSIPEKANIRLMVTGSIN